MRGLGFNQEPPLPEGKMGTSLYNALQNVPGANRFLKKTLRALAEFLNALQDDLGRLIGMGGVNTNGMDEQRAGILQSAFREISQGLPTLRRAIEKLIQNVTNLNDITDIVSLPLTITREVFSSLFSIFHGLFGMLTNGVSYQSIVPEAVPAFWRLIKAVFSDALSSPTAIMRLVAKMMAPGPVARFL